MTTNDYERQQNETKLSQEETDAAHFNDELQVDEEARPKCCLKCGEKTVRRCSTCEDGAICSLHCERQYHASHPTHCWKKSQTYPSHLSCTACGNFEARTCKICRTSAYCSPQCYRQDRAIHMVVCSSFERLKFARPHPPPSVRLIFFFPPDAEESEVRLISVKQIHNPGDFYTFKRPQLGSLIGSDQPVTDHRYLTQDVKLSKDLDHTLKFFMRDAFLKDGSIHNRSILSLTSGSAAHSWRGPIVVLRKPGTRFDPPTFEDVMMMDLTHVLNYFSSYGEKYVEEVDRRLGPEIQAVRISCQADIKLHGSPQFETVLMQDTHSLVTSCIKRAQLTSRVGIPLYLYQQSHDPRVQFGDEDLFNEPASNLCFHVEPGDKHWGHVINQSGVLDCMEGSVIAFRSDCRPLFRNEVEDLCDFAANLQPKFENVLGGGYMKRSQAEVVTMITPSEFAKFRERKRSYSSYA